MNDKPADDYKPPPRACEDFAFIAARLKEIEREKEAARQRKAEAS